MPEGLLTWIITSAAVVLGAVVLHAIAWRVALKVWKRNEMLPVLVRRGRMAARLLIATLAMHVMLISAPFSDGAIAASRHATALTIIGAVAWVMVVIVNVLMDALMGKQVVDVTDNLKARRVRTQIAVIRRLLLVAIVIIAFAGALMTFAQARALGASILASAGVVGLVAGIAARPTLGNLIAGIQIAFTEPIRLDDVVVVEGEWGKVEEITLTYVVVRIWDERRLVLPVLYFVENPFQNWTRTKAEIMGTAFIYADYTVDVGEMRNEFSRIVESSPLWDGRVAVMQVTEADNESVQIRALVSAADSGRAWDLRCDVREQLVAYLQREQPHALPRRRAEIAGAEHPRELLGA